MPEPTREAPRDHNWREEDFGAVISGRYGADDIHISHSADNELRFEVGGWGWFVNALDLIEAVWHVADDTLRESGWRPPPRQIETPEELDALQPGTELLAYWDRHGKTPVGAVVRDATGSMYQRDVEPGNVKYEEPGCHVHWWPTGRHDDHDDSTSETLTLPVTVIDAGTETERTDR